MKSLLSDGFISSYLLCCFTACLRFVFTFFYFYLSFSYLFSQNATYSFKVGKLKYDGGGDWYANPSSLPNFYKFFRQNTKGLIYLEEEIVEPSSPAIFQYPLVYMTGHGNVLFHPKDVENLRKYMLAGGVLLADDNYGMFPYIKRELKKVFPEYELTELSFQHPIFHQQFNFPNGLPKIHEHDGKPAQLFAIIHEGRILCLVTYECDLGDGWEDPDVHKDPEEVRQKAFQMGTNILLYVLMH